MEDSSSGKHDTGRFHISDTERFCHSELTYLWDLEVMDTSIIKFVGVMFNHDLVERAPMMGWNGEALIE